MCGRYYRRSDKQKIAEAFHVAQVDDFALPPWDYNVAPTTQQLVIRNNRDTGERELVSLRWGLTLTVGYRVNKPISRQLTCSVPSLLMRWKPLRLVRMWGM